MWYKYIKMAYDARRNIDTNYVHANCAIDIIYFRCAQELQLKKERRLIDGRKSDVRN